MASVIKKISELDQLTELSSSSNVIIEENGEAKRFNANNIGKVKTVNGVEPDENGNVVVEVPEVEYPVTSVNGMTGDVVIEAGSGSGGGVTSWNDLEDKPFYEEVNEVVMLDNVVINEGMFTMPDFPYTFSDGNTYAVTVNGTEYSCVAYTIDAGGTTITVIGDGSVVGFSGGNGEPFLFYATNNALHGAWDVTDSYTVTIVGANSIIHELNEKFVPYIAGRNVSGHTYIINDADGNPTEVVADVGAESFNGGNLATGMNSHAEGSQTQALSMCTHAEGMFTVASGEHSHAEGYNTIASGDASHAEGYNTIASGDASHAEGESTIAASENQHAQGKWNIEDSADKYAHIVGNGTDDDARSNAHTLDWDGNAWFAGDVYVGGTGQDDTESQKLPTEARVTEMINAAIADIPPAEEASF